MITGSVKALRSISFTASMRTMYVVDGCSPDSVACSRGLLLLPSMLLLLLLLVPRAVPVNVGNVKFTVV